MSGKTISKEEFLRLTLLINQSKVTEKEYFDTKEDLFECTNCMACDCDDYVGEHDIEGPDEAVVDEEDIDIIAMEEILDLVDHDTWKEFVYDLLEEGYTDIPSWKIAEFVNDEFGSKVTATASYMAL